MKKLRPVARLGYYDYVIVEAENIFAKQTPGDDRFVGEDSKTSDDAARPIATRI